MTVRKATVKFIDLDIRPDDPLAMHEKYPFFAFNLVIRPRMAEGVDENGKRTLVVMGMSESVEPEENFLFYTYLLATVFSPGLDLYHIDRIQYLDMVHEGFREQYPDNRTGKEDISFGVMVLTEGLRFEVSATFLDLEDPDRYPVSPSTDVARFMTRRFDEMSDQTIAERGREIEKMIPKKDDEVRYRKYVEDITEAWSFFS